MLADAQSRGVERKGDESASWGASDRCESTLTPRRETASTLIDRDSLLVKALQRREPAAAELLVATYGDRAYRLAKGIAGNAQDAEEAVQDAFWSVVRKIDTFRGDSAFGSWFYRIVANAAYQKLRRRPGRPSEISLDEVLPPFHENGQHVAPIADWSPSVDDPSCKTELRMALTAAIEDLPPDYRTALILHDVEGLSNVEVAGSLGITVANAKSRTHRARLFLRKRLGNFMSDPKVGVADRPQEQRASNDSMAEKRSNLTNPVHQMCRLSRRRMRHLMSKGQGDVWTSGFYFCD